MRLGDSIYDAMKDTSGVNLGSLEQARLTGNQTYEQANLAGGWTDNLDNVSTLALPPFPETIFSHKVFTTGETELTVSFPGTKYNTAVIVASVGYEQPSTGQVGSYGDFLGLRFNGDASSIYTYISHGGYGSTAVELNTTGTWTSTLTQIPLTDWDHSSDLTNQMFHPVVLTLPGVNSTVPKCGILDYSAFIGEQQRRKTVNMGIYYNSTKNIYEFNFSLYNTTDITSAVRGYFAPGSFFTAYGYR